MKGSKGTFTQYMTSPLFHLPGEVMNGRRSMRHLRMKGIHRVLLLALSAILYEPSHQLRSADRTCQKLSKSGQPFSVGMRGIVKVSEDSKRVPKRYWIRKGDHYHRQVEAAPMYVTLRLILLYVILRYSIRRYLHSITS
jgi:hypothetical protein